MLSRKNQLERPYPSAVAAVGGKCGPWGAEGGIWDAKKKKIKNHFDFFYSMEMKKSPCFFLGGKIKMMKSYIQKTCKR